MRSCFASALIVALALAAPDARADTAPQRILVEAHGGWTVIGAKNPITGFTPGLSGTYLWSPSDKVRLGLGLDLNVILGGAPRRTGILGGPTARLEVVPWETPFALSLAISAGLGRAPVCTVWPEPICPQFVGSFPAATISGSYLTESGMFAGGSFSARWFHTLIGDTASLEPSAFIGVYFERK